MGEEKGRESEPVEEAKWKGKKIGWRVVSGQKEASAQKAEGSNFSFHPRGGERQRRALGSAAQRTDRRRRGPHEAAVLPLRPVTAAVRAAGAGSHKRRYFYWPATSTHQRPHVFARYRLRLQMPVLYLAGRDRDLDHPPQRRHHESLLWGWRLNPDASPTRRRFTASHVPACAPKPYAPWPVGARGPES